MDENIGKEDGGPEASHQVSFLEKPETLVSQVPWIQAQEPIQPIEEMTPKNRNLIELGKMLYFDPRLSKSGFI
ncbi:MAG: hypothetical protein VX003_13940, partial [SAR324 cluster bacterium]|nr:hypothetical protein [SAR324 cluster bacterium]